MCNIPLVKRSCNLLPGGIAYVCGQCNHEYTIREYESIKEQSIENNEMIEFVLSEGQTQSSGRVIDLSIPTKKEIPVELRKLLEEQESTSVKSVLENFNVPIEEV